jgi:hypothetical protein
MRTPRKTQWAHTASKCDGRCWYCGHFPDPDDLTVDHALPRSRGGKNRDNNLLPACNRCNNVKGSRTVSGYRKFCKVTVIRRAIVMGLYAGDLSRIKIVFYGEGNANPWSF